MNKNKETRTEKSDRVYGTREQGLDQLRADLQKLGFSLVSSRWPETVEIITADRRGDLEAVKDGVSIRAGTPSDLVGRARVKAAQMESGRGVAASSSGATRATEDAEAGKGSKGDGPPSRGPAVIEGSASTADLNPRRAA